MARKDPSHRSRTETANSIVASAQLLTARKGAVATPAKWQEEAWSYFDTVGELRFGCAWLANALSRVRLTLALRPDAGNEPTPLDDGDPRYAYLDQLAGGQIGQAQLLAAVAVQLTVPGVGYIVGEPVVTATGQIENEWRVLSADEFGVRGDGPTARYTLRDDNDRPQELHPDTLAVKVWRQHPRYHSQPDSPIRALLPILRELSLLTMHVDATATSRLAGAGILFVPTEMVFPVSERNQDAEDPFVAELMDAMLTPIGDRDSAAAVVPLVIKVPAEYLSAIKHLTFATPFDEKALALRDEAIKRFAVGMDMPAEILTGMGSINHWGQWQIEESAQKMHVEPMAEVVCEALTIGFLQPLLESARASDDNLMVWYDTTELTARPNQSADAVTVFDRYGMSMDALRHSLGFTDAQAPEPPELERRILTDLLAHDATLAPAILPALGIDLGPMPMPPSPVPGTPPPSPAPGNPLPTPDTQPGTVPMPVVADGSDDALLAAADGLVVRALEKAGGRLVNEARRTGLDVKGIPPAELHTHIDDATAFTDLDHLLLGAWDRVPVVADRYDIDPDVLRSLLDGYARAVIVARAPHTYQALAGVFGG